MMLKALKAKLEEIEVEVSAKTGEGANCSVL